MDRIVEFLLFLFLWENGQDDCQLYKYNTAVVENETSTMRMRMGVFITSLKIDV